MRWRGDYKVIIISTFWIGLAFPGKELLQHMILDVFLSIPLIHL